MFIEEARLPYAPILRLKLVDVYRHYLRKGDICFSIDLGANGPRQLRLLLWVCTNPIEVPMYKRITPSKSRKRRLSNKNR